MARMQRGMMMASTLLMFAIITSACTMSASNAPAATFTPVQQQVFATSENDQIGMETLAAFATGTALAAQGVTPGAPTATPGIGVTPQVVTATNTPLVVTNATATLALPSGPTSTPIPVGSRPSTYVLQEGEFPFCIARRFDVDPNELLSLSGLSDGVLYPPGTTLRIPQSGSFPGDRMLQSHPTSYTVSQVGETVYGVACAFGDVDPALIASANGISVSSALNVGQTLSIP